MTTNPVTQVLVTSGNAVPLAKGSPVSSLAIGQIGVFNYWTGLSVDTTSPATDLENIFFAVGTDPYATGSMQDINKSAGDMIQSGLVKGYTNRNYSAGAPMIIDITNFTAKCDQEFSMGIEFRNEAFYHLYGYNQAKESFVVSSGCCDGDCPDCGTNANGNPVALQFVTDINAKPIWKNFVTAGLIDYTTTPGTNIPVAVADYATWVAANPGLTLGIRLTSNPVSLESYADINLKYNKFRQTFLVVSLKEAFICNSVQTTTQQLQNEEGLGYDLQQLEYQAGGWNGKPGPYRVSALTGTARPGFVYYAQVAAKYSQLELSYDMRSQSNERKYDANLSTIIAIPCADTTTRNGLIAITDHIFSQFAANAGNAALGDCTGADTTDEYAVANNGVKVVA